MNNAIAVPLKSSANIAGLLPTFPAAAVLAAGSAGRKEAFLQFLQLATKKQFNVTPRPTGSRLESSFRLFNPELSPWAIGPQDSSSFTNLRDPLPQHKSPFQGVLILFCRSPDAGAMMTGTFFMTIPDDNHALD